MKLISHAKNEKELSLLIQSGADEVLLGHQDLSRLGNLTTYALIELAKLAKGSGIRPVLEWDILMTEPQLEKATRLLNELLNEPDMNLFSAIRVQDAGAFEYALRVFPSLPLQLILETGNHNLEGIKRWCEAGGSRIERLILSNQIPKARLAAVIAQTQIPVEVLGLGPILLLYTPRHLLSYQIKEEVHEETLRALANSEEDGHSGFRIIQNNHGTFVFHPKDYCLLDLVTELKEMNLAAFRVDFRLENDSSRIVVVSEILNSANPEAVRLFIKNHPNKVTHCFYQANATDVLFKKLKNTAIQRHDAGYVGEIVESQKDSHMILHVRAKGFTLKKGQTLKLVSPLGAVKEYVVHLLKNLDLKEVEEIHSNEYAVLPHVKLMVPSTTVNLL